jgi:hypothetical protein
MNATEKNSLLQECYTNKNSHPVETTKWLILLVRPAGFEPATYGLEVLFLYHRQQETQTDNNSHIPLTKGHFTVYHIDSKVS